MFQFFELTPKMKAVQRTHHLCEPRLEEAPGAAVFLLAATDAEPAARSFESPLSSEFDKNMQSRPDYGVDLSHFHVKILKTFQVVPSSPGSRRLEEEPGAAVFLLIATDAEPAARSFEGPMSSELDTK